MRRFVCAVYAAVLAGPVAIARELEAAPGLVGWVWYSNVSTGTPSDARHGPVGVDVAIDVAFGSDAELLSWTTTTGQGGRFVFHGLPTCRAATLRIASSGWGPTRSPFLRTPCPSDDVQALPPVIELGRAKVTGRVVGRGAAGGVSPIAGVEVFISVEGNGAVEPHSIHATTGVDGVYRSSASLPLGATVVVTVEAATAAAAGIDTFESAPAGAVRFRLEPTANDLASAPPPASASVAVTLGRFAAELLGWLLPSQARHAPPAVRGLVAPDLVAGTYALCGEIGAAAVSRLHAGGNIPRSVRLLTLPDDVAEAAAAVAGDALRIGPTFATVPVGRDAVLATLHPSRMLSHRYSVVNGGAGPPSTSFCLRGLTPGAYLVHPALTVPEASGGLRVEPPGRVLWVGPRPPPPSGDVAASAAAQGVNSVGPRPHKGRVSSSSPLSFEVLAPSISGHVIGLLPSEDHLLHGGKRSCAGSSSSGTGCNTGLESDRERVAPVRVFVQALPLSDGAAAFSVPVSPAAAPGTAVGGVWRADGLWPGRYLVAACSWEEGGGAGPAWCWAAPEGGGNASVEEGADYELRSPAQSATGEPPSCSRPVEVAVGGDGDADATVTFRQAGFRVTPRAAGGSAPFPLRFRAVSDDGGADGAAFYATANHRGFGSSAAAAPAPSPQSLFSWTLAGLARTPAVATARGLLPLHDAPVEGIRTAAAFVAARAWGVVDALRSVVAAPADAPAALLRATTGLPAPSSDDAASPTLHGPASDFRSWLLDDPHARRRRRFAELRAAAAGEAAASPLSFPRFVLRPAGAAAAAAVAGGAAAEGGGACLPTLHDAYSLDVPRLPCLAIESAAAIAAATPPLAAQPLRWRAASSPGSGGAWGASPALRVSGWWVEGAVTIGLGQTAAAVVAAGGEGGGGRAVCATLASATVRLAALTGDDGEAAFVEGPLLALSPPPPAILAELREACGYSFDSLALPPPSAHLLAAASPSGIALSVDYEPLLRALRASADAPPVVLPVRVGSPLGFGVRLSLCGGQPVEVATAAAPTAASVAATATDGGGLSGVAAAACPSPLPEARGC